MFRNLIFLLSFVVIIAIAQDVAQSPEPATAIRDEYRHAYNLHDADAVLLLYADHAVLLSEAGVFHGKPEIRKWLQFAFDQGSVLQEISSTHEKSSGNLAYGTGTTRRLVGNEIHLGRYLIVMEKRNGHWRIVEHASFNVHE
jgi:ketosteroid isomerase-like protein